MNYSSNIDGAPGTTVTFTANADTAFTLAAMGVDLTDGNGKRAHMVLISIETNSARIAFGADASATLGHLRDPGQALQIAGGTALKEMTLCNDTAGSNFTAQITPFFNNSPAA